MPGRYINVEVTEMNEFVEKLSIAGKGQFRKDLAIFLDGLGAEFLRIVGDEIIRKNTTDTRLLLNSFQKGNNENMFILNEGDMTVEVGTNVTYASYVNDGHWTNPKGVATRWVPGYWTGDHFIYDSGSKTGMLLKQKWVEGSHYFDSAIRVMEKMIPNIIEAKMKQWLEKYFSKYL